MQGRRCLRGCWQPARRPRPFLWQRAFLPPLPPASPALPLTKRVSPPAGPTSRPGGNFVAGRPRALSSVFSDASVSALGVEVGVPKAWGWGRTAWPMASPGIAAGGRSEVWDTALGPHPKPQGVSPCTGALSSAVPGHCPCPLDGPPVSPLAERPSAWRGCTLGPGLSQDPGGPRGRGRAQSGGAPGGAHRAPPESQTGPGLAAAAPLPAVHMACAARTGGGRRPGLRQAGGRAGAPGVSAPAGGGSKHSGKVASHEDRRLPAPHAASPSLVAVTRGRGPSRRAGLWRGGLKAVVAGSVFTGLKAADLGDPWSGEGGRRKGPSGVGRARPGSRCWVLLRLSSWTDGGRRRVVAGLARTRRRGCGCCVHVFTVKPRLAGATEVPGR